MMMWLSIAAAIVAAILGVWAAMTNVRYELLDYVAQDLRRQGRRAAWAAVAAAVAVLLQAADRLVA